MAAGRRLAAGVPALELAVAVGLLFDSLRPPALRLGVVLLLGYAAGIAINLRRGRRELDCGCAGPYDRRPIAAWMAWRNLCLAVLLAAALLPWGERTLVLTDSVTVGFGTACCALVYLCLDRFLSPARRVTN
jgi:hypothetical protein